MQAEKLGIAPQPNEWPSTMRSGQGITLGGSGIASPQVTTLFSFNSPGLVILYNTVTNAAIWSEDISGKGAVLLQMQDNGQLAALNSSNEIVWTLGAAGSSAFLQVFDGYDGTDGGVGLVPYASIS